MQPFLPRVCLSIFLSVKGNSLNSFQGSRSYKNLKFPMEHKRIQNGGERKRAAVATSSSAAMKKPAACKRPAAVKRPSAKTAKTKRTGLGINVEGQECGSTFLGTNMYFRVIYIIHHKISYIIRYQKISPDILKYQKISKDIIRYHKHTISIS